MIASIVFDDTIPITLNRREGRFDALQGWVIEELQPGRIKLTHDDVGSVTVQSMPYTLTTAPDPLPPPQPAKKHGRP